MCDLSVNSKIDFVMIWVDGNDPDWQKEKRAYDPSAKKDDESDKTKSKETAPAKNENTIVTEIKPFLFICYPSYNNIISNIYF